MSRREKRVRDRLPPPDFFDRASTDSELLRSGRIPDPLPEHTPLFRWLAGVVGSAEEILRARGGVGLRWGIRLFWGLIAAVGLFLLVGPIINKPMDVDEVIASSKVEDVDWVAQNASFDYEVSRDEAGGFTVLVTESYTANFINGPEDRVQRSLATEVHGHDARFELLSTTIDGEPVDADVMRRATTTDVVLRPPGGDAFAGTHEIAMSYRLHDLVDVDADEVSGAAVDSWIWPVFAPSWTQATSGLDVSITLPRDLDAALVREPYATVGWLLVSGNVWLTPEEPGAAETVRYAFSNDDNLPPNSDVWIRFVFEADTFELPPRTTLFWVQTWGPLLPLAVLATLMLFALAARRIVWADSAGAPWYLARSEPPDDLTPAQAAQLLDGTRHAELVTELARDPAAGRTRRIGPHLRALRETWLRTVARVGRRAGRGGSLPTVAAWWGRWRNSPDLVTRGLRWKPDSYVRDTFIWAPIAVTLLQWGILRQLSEQFIMLVVWWPFAFVAVSTLIAGVSLRAVWRPRPLTRAGALALQQLQGIAVFSRVTRLLDRGPIGDPLLPYAVLFEPPQRAGDAVTAHAARELGDPEAARGWRTQHFLSLPSMVAFVAAVAALAGSIVLVSVQAPPYDSNKYLTWPSSGASGTVWTQIEGFDISAELQRDDDGAARLDVVERLTVGFDPGGSSVPQFEREWPRMRHGQDLGLEIESVTVDGAAVPFRTEDGRSTVSMTTQISEVIEGDHDVEVTYSLAAPAVETSDGGERHHEVRWTAMHWFWDDTFWTDQAGASERSKPVRPIRVELTVAPDLAAEASTGGWIGWGEADRIPYESGTGHRDWEYVNDMYVDGPSGELGDAVRHELRIGEERHTDSGALVATLDADRVTSRVAEHAAEFEAEHEAEHRAFVEDADLNATLGQHELGLTNDLGAVLTFADGTFTNVEPGSSATHRALVQLPLALLLALTLVVLAGAIGVCVVALRKRGPASTSLLLTSLGTLTAAALAETVIFWWVTGPMAGSEWRIPLLVTLGLAMWAAVFVQWIVVGRRASARAE